MELRDKFQEDKRYKIHIALRDGEKIENWADLDDYLGLFEVCEIMIKNKSIELHDFKNCMDIDYKIFYATIKLYISN